MDPLGALSMAGCVVQFVDFGSRLLKDAREIQTSAAGQPARLAHLSQAVAHLSDLSDDVEQKLSDVCGSTLRQSEKTLLELCEDCQKTKDRLTKLLVEMGMLSDGDGTSVVKGLGTAMKVTLSKGKIEAIEGHLVELRQKLIVTVLIILWDDARASREGAMRFTQQQDGTLSSLKGLTVMTKGLNEVNLTPDGATRIKREFENFIKTTWRPQIHLDNVIPDMSESPLASAQIRTINRAILNGLYHESMEWREQSIPEAHKATFRWIFNKPKQSPSGKHLWSDFPAWLKGQSKDIHWISGKPGAGKSTLMRYIANDPCFWSGAREWGGETDPISARFYSWNAGTDFQKTEEGLLRTLLYQCLSKMPQLIPKLYPRRFTLFQTFGSNLSLPMWDRNELLTSFSTLLSNSGKSFKLVLIIDGLDELEGDHYVLVKLLKEAASLDGTKICVSSRNWNVFNDAFRRSPGIKLEDITRPDIEAFVEHEFQSSDAFRELKDIDPGTAAELLKEIVDKSQGVFLWVDLVVQTLSRNLADGNQLHELRTILDDLPDDLNDLYDRIWSRIEPRYQPEASEILQCLETTKMVGAWLSIKTFWISVGDYSMDFEIDSLTEAAVHASINLMNRRLNSRTMGVLELSPADDSSGDRIDYLHRTAREWLLSNQERIYSRASKGFDSYLTLLKASTIQMPTWLVTVDVAAKYPTRGMIGSGS